VRALLLAGALALSGCSSVKPILNTVNDAARIICELAAAEHADSERAGLTAQQWCAIRKNLDPFIEEALRAQRAGAEKAGLGE